MFMETQVTQLLSKHKDLQTFITIAYSSSCKKLFLKTKPNDTSHMVLPLVALNSKLFKAKMGETM